MPSHCFASRRLSLLLAVVLFVSPWMTVGCHFNQSQPDLAKLYNQAAQYHGPDRRPVIVIPGILGSRLRDGDTGKLLWGAFTLESANPSRASDLRALAIPMEMGVPLSELTDATYSDGALETLDLNLGLLPLQIAAYRDILLTLGVGGYRDQQLAESGAIDYGEDHFTCFQFDYDWRRDNAENAALLYHYIDDRRAYVQEQLALKHGGSPEDYDVEFDIVAHSMGGLISRYMLRYGTTPLDQLPRDEHGQPVPTWEGTEHVNQLIMVGTPNAGSILALQQLVEGVDFSPVTPEYPAALLGTFPSIYQLLPRDRHRPLEHRISTQPGLVLDLAPPPAIAQQDTWEQYQWGLLNSSQRQALRRLLPDAESDEARLAIARDHLAKSLEAARLFHEALDVPAAPPDGTQLHLYAGDGEDTPSKFSVDGQGRLRSAKQLLGDGTVTRVSALNDERVTGPWRAQLVSPIAWNSVTFLPADHLGITMQTTFSDNVLFRLLETPFVLPE